MSLTGEALKGAVTAPAPRKGFGELFAEKKDQLDHFQKSMAGILPSFPGQSIAKYFDLAIGIDFHSTVMPPSPLLPVPHIGMIFDTMGAIMSAIASVLPSPPEPPPVAEGEEPPEQPMTLLSVCSAIVNSMKPTVQAHGRWVANAGTGIQHLPGIFAHIPFPVVSPMASSEMFMGSSTVLADGGPCSTRFHPALSCNLVGMPAKPRMNKPKTRTALMAPTSMLLIDTSGGGPVLVGGPPTIDLFQLAFKLALKGLGKLWKRAGKGMQKLVDRIKSKHPKLGAILQHIKCKFFGEPVDAATGRVYSNKTDFTLPGPIPLQWTRTYYSDAEADGPLGYNWHHSYNMGLYDMGNGYATIRLADGRETVMQLVAYGMEYYNRSEQLCLSRDEEGWLLTDAAKLRYRFEGPENREGYAMLSSVSTADGFSIQFTYNTRGVLRHIKDSRGQLIQVDADKEGRVLRLYTQLENREVTFITYRYDEEGNLIYTCDALGAEKHYVYKGHLLVKLTSQTGQQFYWEYEGSGEEARCIHTWGDEGVLEYWTSYEEGITVTRNSLGFTTRYYYDDRNLIYKIVDANGGITRQVYNEYDELEVTVSPEGFSRRCEYNDYGKMVKLVNENDLIITYEYDERLNLISVQQPSGATAVWEFDEWDRIVSKQFADGRGLNFSYEGRHLKAIEDWSGNRYLLSFDDRNQLMQLTHPDNTYQQWLYNALGNVVYFRDVRGNVTTCTYDDGGNILTMREPDGNRHAFTYDTGANLIHAKDDLHEVSFVYGSLGILLSRTQNGRTVRFSYDTELQLKSISNQAGEVYRFALDGLGDVVSEWGFDGLNSRYERDGDGRVVRILRPGNRWTAYAYDGVGHIVSEWHDDDSGAAFKYNRDGVMSAALNAEVAVRLQRDMAGRVVNEVQGVYTVERQYDAAGNTEQIISSLGAFVQLEHNQRSQIMHMQSHDWQADWRRDAQGLEIQRELSGGVLVRNERDKMGRITRRSIGARHEEQSRNTYQWGKGNRLLQIINELGNVTTQFDYDSWNNLVSATYVTGGSAETIYRAPDKIGNLFETPDRNDRVYSRGGRLLGCDKYNYYYDNEGNLIFKEFKKNEDVTAPDRKLLEKELGVTLTGSATGWRYHWAGNGMLQKVVLPHGSEVVFHYDALGRRIARQHKGYVTRWIWNGNVPLHEWTYKGDYPPAGMVNADGELVLQEEPVADVITWLYDEGSFVPCCKQVGEESYSIIADYLGTPTHAFDKEGNKVWERELDCYGRVKKETGVKQLVPQVYQGQWLDKETGLCYNRFRYYDNESGTYLSQDPLSIAGGMNVYAYVHDPNGWVDIFGLAPVTNTVDFTGHPDLYQGPGKNIVTIKLTGDRGADFTRAFDEAGISKTDATGYTWHHVADFNPETGESTMQLIKTSTHEANLPHKGSAGQFADHFGVKYDTYEAKMKAFEQGWREEPKKKAPKKVKCN